MTETTKRIASLRVIRPGSNPDVDSDFHTAYRGEVIEHVRELYGEANVASIGTFTTLAAKGAFKTMCTIYEVPFAQATKMAELIPPGIEGVDCTIDDIFNKSSERYHDAAEFRNATAGDEWTEIVEGAKAIEGRNKTTGVHPCGIVISSKELQETIPLQVRQKDGLVVTQWTYPDLESLGLIKMDFLGLDTVDLVQATVLNIQKAGLGDVNMLEVINGPMDDKKTFEMLQRAETIGLFQLASDGVQDLLKRIKPTVVDDVIACTALFRPGPMGMMSHVKYADRKNGREPVDFIHEEFKGSVLEEILGATYGLVVYQEQILKIANQIAGMTLQEGDDLRSAMGKKIIPKMAAMKPKFISGGQKNGYSQEAMEELWETCAVFAKYGFNLAHSVAYGITAYEAAYLKANYPREFMAALIAQNIGNKDKTATFLREASRMKLKVGSIDANVSDVKVAPDYTGDSEYDILFGFSGAMAVSEENAETIVAEREKNGLYTSVQDFISRNYKNGVTNRKIYENIAKAGGFDCFNVSRRGVVENLSGMLENAKTKGSKGADLFDMFGGGAAIETASIDLEGAPEYPYVDKLKMEAEVIGLYLTSHPLSNVGPGLSKARSITIENLMKSSNQVTVKLTGALTEIIKKTMRRGGKSIVVTLDDGTGYVQANVARPIVKGIEKLAAQEKIKHLYEIGEKELPEELISAATSKEFKATQDLEKNAVYSVSLTFRPARGEAPYGARINEIEKLDLSDDGSLPIRMRFLYDDSNEEKMKKLYKALPKAIAKKHEGTYSILAALEPKSLAAEDENAVYEAAIKEIQSGAPIVSKAKTEAKASKDASLWGNDNKKKVSTAKKKNEKVREWPPVYTKTPSVATKLSEERVSMVTYVDTGLKASKSKATELDIEKYIGVENFDFGAFDPTLLED